MSTRLMRFLGGTAVVALLAPGAAWAQVVPADPPVPVVTEQTATVAENEEQGAPAPAAEPTDPTEIVVTAQRRSERLQDIPLSIAAIGADTIRDTGISSLTNIAPRVPGFYFGGFGTSRPQLYIRGIGTRQFDPGSESSVGVFVDESYLGRTGGVLGALRDIERVEVLKGPQGTLYGRNTIAGAINIITKGPTDRLDAEFEASLGNYNTANFLAAVSGPIAGEAVKARLALWRTYSKGYVTNLTTGNRAQGTDNFGGRLRFELNPTENLKINLIGEIIRDDGPSFQGESIGNTANPNGVLLGRAGLVPRKSDDPYKQFYTSDPAYNRDVETATAKVELDLGPGTLVSVTSFRQLEFDDDRDFDNTSLNVIRQLSFEKSKQVTQELRFVSEPDGPLSFGGALDFIFGAFYYRDDSQRSDTFLFGPDSVVFAAGTQPTDIASSDFDTTSYALFAQGTLNITDQLELTLGGRYTHDKKRATLIGQTNDARPLIPANFIVGPLERSFSSFDPRIALAFKPNEQINLYAQYSQGFKSGGFQYISLNPGQANLIFDPEGIDAYEVGIKTTLLNRKLYLNAAAFQYDYANVQVSRIVEIAPGVTPTLITNAAQSRIRGFEVDATLRLIEGLSLDAAYAYTDAKYQNYIFNATTDFSNTRLVRAPKHSFHIGAQYEAALTDRLGLIARGDVSYLSDFFHEPGEANPRFGTTTPFTREDGYALTSARIGLAYDQFRLTAFVENMFDVTYRQTVQALPGQVINFYGRPRTYGLTLNYRI